MTPKTAHSPGEDPGAHSVRVTGFLHTPKLHVNRLSHFGTADSRNQQTHRQTTLHVNNKYHLMLCTVVWPNSKVALLQYYTPV